MAEDTKEIVTLTKPALGSFLQGLFEAKVVGKKGAQGTPKFSANFETELDSPDVTFLKAAAVRVAKKRWPGRDIKELQFPFELGDKVADAAKKAGKEREWSRGKFVIKARSKFDPVLSYVDGGRFVENLEGEQRVAAKKYFYNGVSCLAEFNFVAYDGVGNNPDGVTCYLQKVCSLNKGERLKGAAVSSAETFKQYIGTSTDYDPTAGDLDDEIPF